MKGPSIVVYDSATSAVPTAAFASSNNAADSAACPRGLLRRDGICTTAAVAPPKVTLLSFIHHDKDGDRDSDIDSTASHNREKVLVNRPIDEDLRKHDDTFSSVMQELLDKTNPEKVEIEYINPVQRVSSPISPSEFLAGDVLKLNDGRVAYKVPEGYRPLGRSSWAMSLKKRAPPAEIVEHHEAPMPYRGAYTNSVDSFTSCDDRSDRYKRQCRGRRRRPHRFLPWKRDVVNGTNSAELRRRGKDDERAGRRYGRQRTSRGREWESDGMSVRDDVSLDGDDFDRRALSEHNIAKEKRSIIVLNHAKDISPEVLRQLDSATHSRSSDYDDRHSEMWSDEWDTRTTCDHASDLDKPGCNAEKLRKNMLLSSDVHIMQSAGPIAKDESRNVDGVLGQAGNVTGDETAAKANDAIIADGASNATKREDPTPLSSNLLKRATEQSLGSKADRDLAREKFIKRWLDGDEKPRRFEAMNKPLMKRQSSANLPVRLNRHELMKRAVGAGMLPGGTDGLVQQPNPRLPSIPARKGPGRSGRRSGRRRHRKAGANRGPRLAAPPAVPFAKRQLKDDCDKIKAADNRTQLANFRQNRTSLANKGRWRQAQDPWPSTPTDPYSAESEWSNDSDADLGHRWTRPGMRRLQRRGDSNFYDATGRESRRNRFNWQRRPNTDFESLHSASTRPDLRFICPGGICMRSEEKRPAQSLLTKRSIGKRGRNNEVDDVASVPDDHDRDDWDKRSHSSGSEEECRHCHHHRHHGWWRRMFSRRGIDRDNARDNADNASVNSALSQVGRV